jgi:hypothetical protein
MHHFEMKLLKQIMGKFQGWMCLSREWIKISSEVQRVHAESLEAAKRTTNLTLL